MRGVACGYHGTLEFTQLRNTADGQKQSFAQLSQSGRPMLLLFCSTDRLKLV